MRISVAMATYNGESFIKRQLESIINQSLSIDEIVVVDDVSQDRTLDIVNAFTQKYPNINWIVQTNKKNLGYILNFKKALSLTSGDIIFLSDQDDIWHQNKVETMIEIMSTHEEILSLGSAHRLIDDDDHLFSIKQLEGYSNNNLLKKEVAQNSCNQITLSSILFQNFCQGAAMAISRELADKFIDICVDDISHDWQLNLLAALHNGAYFLNMPLFDYRIHNNNVVGLGTASVTLPFKEKLNLALNTRMDGSQCILKNIYFLEKINGKINLQEMKKFLEDHIYYLENKKFWKLLKQNLFEHRLYKLIKPLFVSRILDLIYALNIID